MKSKLVFIYDGQCPFCNHFAQLIELKSGIKNIEIKNARDNLSALPQGYDMDESGAILLIDSVMLSGPSAINFICAQIKDPSDALLEILRILFKSRVQTRLLFPFLLFARRLSLLFKGVPWKIMPE